MIKNKKILSLIIFVMIVLITSVFLLIFFLIQNNKNQNLNIFGVWWWDNRIDNSYLEFAKNNNINEIYYYTSSFNEKTSNFIKQANDKEIKVYWLTGKCEWIEDNSDLIKLMNEFLEFQNSSSNKFAGIHFDIEPHQIADFEERKTELLTKFVNLTMQLKQQFSNIFIEYAIPVWMHDKLTINNITKPTYEFIIDNANRVTLMSYRDSCDKIYDCSKDEIEYAISVCKTLNLGVETQKIENENFITFYEEGSNFMFQELKKLRKLIPTNFGIAIHHIISWKNLKP